MAGKQKQLDRFKHIGALNLAMAAIVAVLFILSLTVGSVGIPLAGTLKVLVHGMLGRPETDGALITYSAIINGIRLPRVITAALVGAALAVSGAAMQGLLKNPLADGSILGISSGGALGAVLCIALGSVLPPALAGLGLPVFSMAFSFLSLLAVLTLSWRIDRGFSTNTIILIGVVFSMLAGSLTSLVIAFSGNKLDSLVFWLMGSLSASKFSNILWLFPVCLFGIIFLQARSQELNAFAMGEEQAGYIGVNTRSVKLQIMVTVAVLIGASVSVSGIIGFVGLIPPHIMRLFAGSNHKRLLPSTALFGAAFLMAADLISRTAVRPLEIPIGVVTALAGSLIFFYLYNMMRRRTA
jgi:iron complex transport system permease protein